MEGTRLYKTPFRKRVLSKLYSNFTSHRVSFCFDLFDESELVTVLRIIAETEFRSDDPQILELFLRSKCEEVCMTIMELFPAYIDGLDVLYTVVKEGPPWKVRMVIDLIRAVIVDIRSDADTDSLYSKVGRISAISDTILKLNTASIVPNPPSEPSNTDSEPSNPYSELSDLVTLCSVTLAEFELSS